MGLAFRRRDFWEKPLTFLVIARWPEAQGNRLREPPEAASTPQSVERVKEIEG